MNWVSCAVADPPAPVAESESVRGMGRYFFVPSIAVRPSFWAVLGSTGRGSFGFCSPRCSFGKFSGLLGTPASSHQGGRCRQPEPFGRLRCRQGGYQVGPSSQSGRLTWSLSILWPTCPGEEREGWAKTKDSQEFGTVRRGRVRASNGVTRRGQGLRSDSRTWRSAGADPTGDTGGRTA
jgi:hypothetical protein